MRSLDHIRPDCPRCKLRCVVMASEDGYRVWGCKTCAYTIRRICTDPVPVNVDLPTVAAANKLGVW